MIIWLTGQPGSGKTTLANSLIDFLRKDKSNIKIINLDGDDLRAINKNKDLIIKEIKSIHSYNTPEIICYDFDILSNKYENWFFNNIK